MQHIFCDELKLVTANNHRANWLENTYFSLETSGYQVVTRLVPMPV